VSGLDPGRWARSEGFEPPTPRFEVWSQCLIFQRNSANRKRIRLHEVNGLACHLQTRLCQQSIIPSKSDAIQTGPLSADYRTGIIRCS
jgi:hypothetical protein